ncbi:MAG: ribonuclease D [Coriobacteriales bacterium]|jgi:ribonuclease D|nr:ribonuclease D [Coriobacteriales bacterium]
MAPGVRRQRPDVCWIETDEALTSFCERIAGTDVLAIDTEFLREKTYYPQLCLLQLATREQLVLIDPLAQVDLGILKPCFADTSVAKVFHAGDQDRAILFQEIGVSARPVFDTQWASMLLGLPLQASLAVLVKRYQGIDLAKMDTFSDWSARPLTPRQLAYAADDVRYLPNIYDHMIDELADVGRLAWLEQDFEHMAQVAETVNEPREMWHKVKHATSLNSGQLARLRELAAWRESTAQKRNLPRKWIMSDELLVELVRADPADLESLFRIRGLRDRLGRLWATEILTTLEEARLLPDDQWPRRLHANTPKVDNAAAHDLMNALVRLRAHELHIAPSYLASASELKALAAGEKDLDLFRGWRRDLIGEELLALLEGRLALSFHAGKLQVTTLSQ